MFLLSANARGKSGDCRFGIKGKTEKSEEKEEGRIAFKFNLREENIED
jgi:hypothetical protein